MDEEALNKAKETAYIMSDLLDDPERRLGAIIYLRGFFPLYSSAVTMTDPDLKNLAKVVLDQLEAADIQYPEGSFGYAVRERVWLLLIDIRSHLKSGKDKDLCNSMILHVEEVSGNDFPLSCRNVAIGSQDLGRLRFRYE